MHLNSMFVIAAFLVSTTMAVAKPEISAHCETDDVKIDIVGSADGIGIDGWNEEFIAFDEQDDGFRLIGYSTANDPVQKVDLMLYEDGFTAAIFVLTTKLRRADLNVIGIKMEPELFESCLVKGRGRGYLGYKEMVKCSKDLPREFRSVQCDEVDVYDDGKPD